MLQEEIRKRPAFGILRTEVFVSLLLGTRPLLSFEGVNLYTPASNVLWNGSQGENSLSQELSDHAISAQEKQGYLFSDLLRVALEQDEQLPNLRSEELELLLFGLQHYFWRFSHDPQLASRLSISFGASNGTERPRGSKRSLGLTARHEHAYVTRDRRKVVCVSNKLRNPTSTTGSSFFSSKGH